MIGPSETQKEMQEAEWYNPKNDIQDPLPPAWSSNGPEKACNIATNLLKAIPRVFPAHTVGRKRKKTKQNKDESVVDFKTYLEALFLQKSRFHTINTPPSLTVNG